MFTPKIGEDEPILRSIFFNMGWFNHQLDKPWKGHLEGEQPQLEDLLTMVGNHLQVPGWSSTQLIWTIYSPIFPINW